MLLSEAERVSLKLLHVSALVDVWLPGEVRPHWESLAIMHEFVRIADTEVYRGTHAGVLDQAAAALVNIRAKTKTGLDHCSQVDKQALWDLYHLYRAMLNKVSTVEFDKIVGFLERKQHVF